MEDKLEPVKIYPQRCFKCNSNLSMGDVAYAHVVNPVAVCAKCFEATPAENRATLALAVVSE
jgi:hypothetical protein